MISTAFLEFKGLMTKTFLCSDDQNYPLSKYVTAPYNPIHSVNHGGGSIAAVVLLSRRDIKTETDKLSKMAMMG